MQQEDDEEQGPKQELEYQEHELRGPEHGLRGPAVSCPCSGDNVPSAACRDLMLYKSILTKLSAAKELMAEFVEREKKKQAEREADKAARAAKV